MTHSRLRDSLGMDVAAPKKQCMYVDYTHTLRTWSILPSLLNITAAALSEQNINIKHAPQNARYDDIDKTGARSGKSRLDHHSF